MKNKVFYCVHKKYNLYYIIIFYDTTKAIVISITISIKVLINQKYFKTTVTRYLDKKRGKRTNGVYESLTIIMFTTDHLYSCYHSRSRVVVCSVGHWITVVRPTVIGWWWRRDCTGLRLCPDAMHLFIYMHCLATVRDVNSSDTRCRRYLS